MLTILGFQGGTVVKNLPVNAGNAGDVNSVPEYQKSPGAGNGNPLQYSCLDSSMDRGAWYATVHGATKSWTRLTNTHSCIAGRFFTISATREAPYIQ